MTQGENQVRVIEDSGQDGYQTITREARVRSRGLLSIHEFAQVCRTTPRTLRFYEQKGLFRPAKVDPNNKYRFYGPKQARDFLKIRLLQNFHIPLAQIRGSLSKKSAEEFINKKLKRLKEEIREKEKEYRFLGRIKKFLFENEIASSPAKRSTRNDKKSIFQTKTFGPYNLFCMRVEHGEYAKINDYIKTLWKEAKRLKLNCEKSEITFYLNSAYNPKNTPLEIATILRARIRQLAETSREVQRNKFSTRRVPYGTVPFGTSQSRTDWFWDGNPSSSNNNNFYFKSYPKTKILAFNYTGPYEYLILIYQKLFSYIQSQKINLKGLVFETYKYGPLNTESKYDYQTTIGFPI